MTEHLLKVVCHTCNNQTLTERWSENLMDLHVMMLACHAQNPHTTGHELRGFVDGVCVTHPDHQPEQAMFEVYLFCEYCSAKKNPIPFTEVTYTVSRAEYVPAVCLHWHSLHEGHKLRCKVRENGGEWEQLHPPVEEEAQVEAAAQ